MTRSMVQSVPAELLVNEITGLGVTHVVTVPDTHQRTLLELLAEDSRLSLLTVSTEDEAIGVNAGLWIGGRRTATADPECWSLCRSQRSEGYRPGHENSGLHFGRPVWPRSRAGG